MNETIVNANDEGLIEPSEFHGMDVSQWSRMSWWANIFIVWKIFKAIFIQNWPTLIALFAFLKSQSFSLPLIVGGAVGTALLIGILSLLSFWNTRFFWDDEAFFMRSGVLNKKLRRIPFERIQSVNTSQSIVHRFFKLVSIDLDSAGSAGQEIQISAVRKQLADDLSEKVYAFRQQMSAEELHELMTPASEVATSNAEERITKVKTSDIALYALFENHLKTIGLILAFLLTIFQQINDAFEDAPQEFIEQQSQEIFKNFESNLAFTLIFVGIVSIGVTILFTVTRLLLTHFNTELFRTSKGYRKVSGLLTRKKTELGLSKVQMVKWTTNPFKYWFGLFGFTLANASPKTTDPNNLFKTQFFIPALRWDAITHTVERILNRPIPDMDAAPNPIAISYIFRHTRYYGFLPAFALASIFFYFEQYVWLLLPLTWWMLILGTFWLYHRNYRFQFDEKTAWIKSGVIGRKWKAIEWFKIHNVTLQTTPHQRKKGLYSVVLHTSGDTLKIPYIPQELAEHIRNIALWQTNTEHRPWM